jgi:DMSO/TMAO reductase YedYZ molybdopterin-dependent catalytic subunit
MIWRWRYLLFALLSCVTVGLVSAQSTPTLTVSGAIRQPLTLTATDLVKMPRAMVKSNSFGIVYEGVWLSDVLKKAGVAMGELRGAGLVSYVLASAEDGYQVLFSLAELDPAVTDGQVLVADTANGKPLIEETGVFRLVLPNDKSGARSVKLLRKLEVVQLKK